MVAKQPIELIIAKNSTKNRTSHRHSQLDIHSLGKPDLLAKRRYTCKDTTKHQFL